VGALASGATRSVRRGRSHRLESSRGGFPIRGGKKGGETTGPNSADRGKPGTKRHLVSDRTGIPLAVILSPANRHDSMLFEPLLDAIPAIRRPHGGRRHRPDKAHADKAYDIPRCHAALRQRRIRDRIARKRVDSSATLGRHRWVIERTLAWLNRFRRLTIRYERRADIHAAFVTLGCVLICLNYFLK